MILNGRVRGLMVTLPGTEFQRVRRSALISRWLMTGNHDHIIIIDSFCFIFISPTPHNTYAQHTSD